MAFNLILTYLESTTSLRRTTDFYEGSIPEDKLEGTQLRIVTETDDGAGFEEDFLVIDVFSKTYKTAYDNAKAIFNALKARRGALGTTNAWTIQGKIVKEYAGPDNQRRHIFEIRCIVKH
jgi:hypothetical protein